MCHISATSINTSDVENSTEPTKKSGRFQHITNAVIKAKDWLAKDGNGYIILAAVIVAIAFAILPLIACALPIFLGASATVATTFAVTFGLGAIAAALHLTLLGIAAIIFSKSRACKNLVF